MNTSDTLVQLDKIYVVKSIMTPKKYMLHCCDGDDRDEAWRKADELAIDSIPYLKDGEVAGILHTDNRHELITLEYSQVVSWDMSIRAVIKCFAEGKHDCLIVQGGQGLVGMVTPADLNKLPSRSYFYNLLAQLEINLMFYIRDFFNNDEVKVWQYIRTDKRCDDLKNKLRESKLELDLWQLLNLSEFVNIIKDVEDLHRLLQFDSPNQVKNMLNGLVHLRNDIAHPNHLLADNDNGFKELHNRQNRIIEMLERIPDPVLT